MSVMMWFCVWGARASLTRPLSDDEMLSYVHIPKAAGASFVADGHRLFTKFYPKVAQGQEHGSLYDRKRRPEAAHLVILRSPRTHVVSQYAECRYDAWGRKVTASTSFPRNGSFSDDLLAWVKSRDDFNCYDPRNMQARYLSSDKQSAHAFAAVDMDVALEQLDSMSWIGIVEFYHASLCSLVFRKRALVDYATSCDCAAPKTAADTHKRHYHGDVPPSASALQDPSLIAQIDLITNLDRIVYRRALSLFFWQVKWIERHAGVRFLCEDAIAAAQPDLAYIHHNLTRLYEHQE